MRASRVFIIATLIMACLAFLPVLLFLYGPRWETEFERK